MAIFRIYDDNIGNHSGPNVVLHQDRLWSICLIQDFRIGLGIWPQLRNSVDAEGRVQEPP